jgi:hypothetical protein
MNKNENSSLLTPNECECSESDNNDWGKKNNNTLKKWIFDCYKQQFVFEYVIDDVLSKSKGIRLGILILSAIQALLSFSNLGINEYDYPTILLAFKIIVSILSTMIYILTQYMTIEKFENTIKEYTKYTDFIDVLLSKLIATSNLKPELRENGNEFILKYNDTYAEIYKDPPYIKQSYWLAGVKLYNIYENDKNIINNYNSRKRRIIDSSLIV